MKKILYFIVLACCILMISCVKNLNLLATEDNHFSKYYNGLRSSEIDVLINNNNNIIYKCESSEIEHVKNLENYDFAKKLYKKGYWTVGYSSFISSPFNNHIDMIKFSKSLGVCYTLYDINPSISNLGVGHKYISTYGIRIKDNTMLGIWAEPADENTKIILGKSKIFKVNVVMEKSAAYYANILKDDIIISFNNKPYDLNKYSAIKNELPKENTIDIIRNGKIITKKIIFPIEKDSDFSYNFLKKNIITDKNIFEEIPPVAYNAPANPRDIKQEKNTQIPDNNIPWNRIVGSGTGFFITNNGYLVTNYHVVSGGTQYIIIDEKNNKLEYAYIIDVDKNNDIAILKSNIQSNPFPIASGYSLKRGEEIMTLGYPKPDKQGIEQKATFGRVNALTGLRDDPREIQVDLPVQPGNSGGPLIDKKGNVCGIITSTLRGNHQNVNYAVKSSLLYNMIKRNKNIYGGIIKEKNKIKNFSVIADEYKYSSILILKIK